MEVALMATTNLTRYTIVDGPVSNLLFDALKYAFSKENRIKIYPTFSIDSKLKVGKLSSQIKIIQKINLKIVGLHHEDGSGHSFLFEGYVVGGDLIHDGLVSGYYNARQKAGYINI